MDPQFWKKAQQLFHDAVELDGEVRAAFLDDACAGNPELRATVDRMLAADASAPEWLDRGAEDVSGILDFASAERHPVRLGPYRILRVLASGGMGTVYEGEREDDFRMRVAIKRIRPGPTSAELLGRFHRERQILANLQHPAIARLLDGGQDPEGGPWFAMEYVDGTPLDGWCDARRLGIEDRLRLFVLVCRAVQYAHLNLVLHRDLKPSNILVTGEGEPKLLDFGIARILDVDVDSGTTREGGRQPLTPEYASPEQFKDEPLTTASDVYQLGLLLYRLLAGRPPHAETTTERELTKARMERPPTWPSATVLQPPPPPSTGPTPTAHDVAALRRLTPERLARRLRGDLDNIVLKALRPEPRERYASVEALADDLERHLEGRPVRARPPSLGYRIGRFARRNRLAVGAGAAVTAAVVLGAAAALSQARRAAAERDLAQEVSAFLEDLLTAPDPFQGALGPTDSVRMVDFIAYADDRIRNGLLDRPATRARMLTLLGRVQGNLGRWDQAVPTLQEAVNSNREIFGAGAVETVEALRNLGFALAETGSPAEGESALREALAGQIGLTGKRSLEVASIQELLARGLLNARRLDEAEPLLRGARDTRAALLGELDPSLVGPLNGLAALSSFRGNDAGALVWQAAAVAVLEAAGPEQRANLGITLGNLGGLYRRLGRMEDADAALTRGLSILSETVGREHFLTAVPTASLAAVRARLGRFAEADSLWASAVRTLEGTNPGNLALAGEQAAWARALREQGRLGEAEARARSSVEAARHIGGPGHPLVAMNMAVLGDVLRDAGQPADADRAYGSALDVLAGAPPGDANVTGIRASRAELWEGMGRVAEAEAEFREAHAGAEAALGRGHPVERRAAEALAAFLNRQGRGPDAAPFR